MNKTNILIADDNETVVSVLKRTLGGSGSRILWAADGPSALKIARQGGIDIILLDVNMPPSHDAWITPEVLDEVVT